MPVTTKIHHPETGRWLATPCTGCMCHDLAMQFGKPNQGCCTNCGCPKNQLGWDDYARRHPDRLHGYEPTIARPGDDGPGDAPCLSTEPTGGH